MPGVGGYPSTLWLMNHWMCSLLDRFCGSLSWKCWIREVFSASSSLPWRHFFVPVPDVITWRALSHTSLSTVTHTTRRTNAAPLLRDLSEVCSVLSRLLLLRLSMQVTLYERRMTVWGQPRVYTAWGVEILSKVYMCSWELAASTGWSGGLHDVG